MFGFHSTDLRELDDYTLDDGECACHNYPLDKYEIDKFQREQFTGLKDKNGVEIYEGDIMCLLPGETNKLHYYTVKYIGNSFVLDGELTIHKESIYFTEREIIGNIYETPNLL